jgi:hypothetical protein
MKFVPNVIATLTESEAAALRVALRRSLELYRTTAPFYNVEAAPEGSGIGMQRDMLAGLDAIMLGNRRGSDKYQIKMVQA